MAFYDKWFKKEEDSLVVVPKMIKGTMPTEEAIAVFEPLVDFTSKSFEGTEYKTGQNYTLRKHNLKLAVCLHKWANLGRVRIVALGDDPLLKVIETGVYK